MSGALDKIDGLIDKGIGLVEAEPAFIIIHDFRGSLKQSPTDKTKFVSEGAEKALAGQSSVTDIISGSSNRIFRVQYNPSELQVYTTNEAQIKLGENTKGDETTQPVTSGMSVAEFSVSLFFDDMKIADSFMLDKPILPVSASAIGNLAGSFFAGKYSVQKIVEGFIAALQNRCTRVISFCWNNFSFTGTLTSVTAEYIMFSTLGRPVRAKVALRMRKQADEKYFGNWMNSFEESFGGDNTNLVTSDQYVSNILNMNLGL